MRKLLQRFKLTPRLLFRQLIRLGRFVLLIYLLLALTTASLLPEKSVDLHLGALTAGQRFDWFRWEAQAISEEAIWWLRGRPLLEDEASGPVASAAVEVAGGGDTGARQKAEILAFVERQGTISDLEDRIRGEYAQLPAAAEGESRGEPDSPPPALRNLERKLEALYRQQGAAASRAERILATQVGQVLVAQGFGLRGGAWPVVTFRFNDMPTFLVVSQRDEIAQYRSLYLLPDMPEGDRARLEAQIEADLNVSALVENVGGIGSWPTMVADPVSLPSLLDVIAHEWTHNYLEFHPLGQHYSANRDLTTMNETVASLVGAEVAALTLARFYPELAPPPVPPPNPPRSDEADGVEEEATAPTEETFAQAMRRIRLHVDDLLAAGQVEEAEAYMEAERQELVARGHHLRKLNQAYFAFHGSYATGPTSVDPIGPWMRQLRAQHDSLKSFIDQVAQMSSLDELLQVVGKE